MTQETPERSKGETASSAPTETGGSTAPLSELSDQALVKAARDAAPGDQRAFTELLRRYQNHVYANCRYLASSEDADDLTQEVLVRVYFGLSRFEGRSSFKTWLDRVKSNHCINHLKKGRSLRERTVALEAAHGLGELASQESFPEQLTRQRLIEDTLSRISPALRVPLVLSDMDGLKLSEIADVLGISLSAAKMRVMRGREAFRKLFDGRILEESDAG